MIKSFRHRGLEKFFYTGSKAGMQPAHAKKLDEILSFLNAATTIEVMNVSGWALHPLKGDLAGHWSVKVSGNWRVTFQYVQGHAEIVDYRDYH